MKSKVTTLDLLREIERLRKELSYDLTGPKRPNRQKLTDREVKDIRLAYRGGASQALIAHSYEVNPATISRTVRGLYHA